MNMTDLNYLWLDSIFFDDIVDELLLSDEDKEMIMTYKNDGYLIIDTYIDDEIIDNIVNDKNIVYSGNGSDTKRAVDTWRINSNVRKLATLPKIDKIITTLYQRNPIPFKSINFKIGSEKVPHSDAIHFNSFPEGFMCGVWIALEDIHESNGAITLFPGSHKLPYTSMLDVNKIASKATTTYEFYEDYEKYIETLIHKLKLPSKIITLKKGQALIWAANMLHSGSKIIDKNLTRYSQVTHYYFENCMFYGPLFSDIPLNKIQYWNITNIKTDELVEHKYLGETIALKNSKFKRVVDALKEESNFNIPY